MDAEVGQDLCAVLLKRVDNALQSTAGAMLSQEQFDEVIRLRREIRDHCEAGKIELARQAESSVMAIIQQRAPGRAELQETKRSSTGAGRSRTEC